MVSYEIYYISAIKGRTEITSNIMFSKNLEITSHCVEFYKHGKPRNEPNIMKMVHFGRRTKWMLWGKESTRKKIPHSVFGKDVSWEK